MKTSPYSPDAFMAGLYKKFTAEPYKDAVTAEEVAAVSESIKAKAKDIFNLSLLGDNKDVCLEKTGKTLNYPDYTLEKYSFEICDNLKSLVYVLTPKNADKPTPGVVALCGHGYGVRQILNISKKGNKKHIRYIDNYQKNFAVELAKKGCTVIAPELFGFGEARLKKDLIKPFYISSCDELSHHLLPYGLTTASLRVYQAIRCVDVLMDNANVDKDRIGCMGISGGGLTALYASVLDERIKRIVISGYVNSFRDSIMSMWHCPDNYIPDIMRAGEIYDFASSLAPRELLIESGTKDRIFPIKASLEAHEKIKSVYAKMNASDKLIIDVFDGKHSVSGAKSFEFLSKQ